MNAHEAMKYMKQYVKELDTLISHHKAHDIEMLGSDHFPEIVRRRHKGLDDKREAVSIVLESAKLLHENIVEGSVDTNGHGVSSVEIKQCGDENTIYLSSEKLLAIGIEEGADE